MLQNNKRQCSRLEDTCFQYLQPLFTTNTDKQFWRHLHFSFSPKLIVSVMNTNSSQHPSSSLLGPLIYIIICHYRAQYMGPVDTVSVTSIMIGYRLIMSWTSLQVEVLWVRFSSIVQTGFVNRFNKKIRFKNEKRASRTTT